MDDTSTTPLFATRVNQHNMLCHAEAVVLLNFYRQLDQVPRFFAVSTDSAVLVCTVHALHCDHPAADTCFLALTVLFGFQILNFNFKAGQELPIHSHDIEGQLSIAVLEGSGEFLGEDETTIPAQPGDVLISEISEPHGLRAETDMRVLVTIAPPI